MKEGGTSTKWILAIVGATFTGFLYLICCICSIHKALKDRRSILERNYMRRNKKYLKEIGIDSEKITVNHEKTNFAISKRQPEESEVQIESKPEVEPVKTVSSVHLPTKAKKINLDDIEEILNESLSVNASINSSAASRVAPDNSQSLSLINDENIKSDQPMVTSLRKPKIIESVPKVYYLKAHNSSLKDNYQQSNWITERLSNANAYAEAQHQLQYGLKKAPLAKQNSGFSSMDEDSSSSYNF